MPSGLVTVRIMHNKPPKEFTSTHIHTLPVTIATLVVLLPLTSKSDVISASQQPEGAMEMTEYSSTDDSSPPPSLLQLLQFSSPPFLSWLLPSFLPCSASLLGAQASRTRHKNKPRKVRSGWLELGQEGVREEEGRQKRGVGNEGRGGWRYGGEGKWKEM